MKLYVIHLCDVQDHTFPLKCNCHTTEEENGQLTFMCREKNRVNALDPRDTAYHVKFQCSGTTGHYDVSRLQDTDLSYSYVANNRE